MLGAFIEGILVLIIVGVFALILVVLNYYMLRTIRETRDRENAARTWPSVTGEIVTSQTKSHTHLERGTVTYPEVIYTYTVDGKTHKSSNIMAGGEISTLDVETTLARYPSGAKVTVYYDPHNPKDAVLEPGKKTVSRSIILMLVAMNIIVCVTGVSVIYGMLK